MLLLTLIQNRLLEKIKKKKKKKVRILKSHPLLKMVNSYIIDNPQPSNISYLWNFGSLLAFCLVIQIITGVTLAMHYNPNVLEAFDSVEHIMRDVNNGWLLRYLHSNTASAFFFIVYLHIGRGLYYGSYRAPRTLVWTIGTVIFLLMMATAFLGYVLPYGQMSLWGATVITNLMSAIPWVGQDIVEFIWGGFSVNNATLNRFFALHFVLPFVLAALALMHLIALHDSAGSGNPLGISGNSDRLPFAPYFIFKDLVTIFLFILVLSIFVFFMPNVLGDSENYVMANPMQTPPAIVPEWYLLPFYAILRSIPNKLLGVIAMFLAILILLAMPFTDLSRSRGIQFRPLSKIAFFIFLGNFLILMQLGAKHVESPYIELGQISTVVYFSYFLIIVPVLSLLENSLLDLASFFAKQKQQEQREQQKQNNNFDINIYNIAIFNAKQIHYMRRDLFVDKIIALNNSNGVKSSFLEMYAKTVSYLINKKIYILSFIFCFIFFCLFIHILLIVLTDYSYIDSPYGLIGVDYADNKYAKWLMADLQKERESLLNDYKYYTERIEDCNFRVQKCKDITEIYQKLPSRGFNPPGLDKSIQHYSEKWAAFQREYDAWERSMVKCENDLSLVNERIDQKYRGWRAINVPW